MKGVNYYSIYNPCSLAKLQTVLRLQQQNYNWYQHPRLSISYIKYKVKLEKPRNQKQTRHFQPPTNKGFRFNQRISPKTLLGKQIKKVRHDSGLKPISNQQEKTKEKGKKSWTLARIKITASLTQRDQDPSTD